MDQLWVEAMGGIIVTRIRGTPNEEMLKTCQARILSLVNGASEARILHDCLAMESPGVEVPLSQWNLDSVAVGVRLRRAVVVPNTRLAYLARLAFGSADCRVFYNDIASALHWLSGE